MARDFAAKQGHELGIFKPTNRTINTGTITYAMSFSGAPGSVIAIGSGTYSTTATTNNIVSPTSSTALLTPFGDGTGGTIRAQMGGGKWFVSRCVYCEWECWLSEEIDLNKHFAVNMDRALHDGMYVAQKLNKLAEQEGNKLPFPKRAKGIIFGKVLGERCERNPRLLPPCGDLSV